MRIVLFVKKIIFKIRTINFKILSPFTVVVFLFISVFATTALVQTRQLLQKKAAVINLPDIDVTYINRSPSYDYDTSQKWPSSNQNVTFTAYIKNNGPLPTSTFDYVWKIDDITYNQGTFNTIILPGQTVSLSTDWLWQHDVVDGRVSGNHIIEFIADSNNSISEISETNNSIKDYTQALAIGFWVEQSIYDFFNQNQYVYCQGKSCAGSNSWEDWAQRQVELFNTLLAVANQRVRLDKIFVVSDCTLNGDSGPLINPNKTVDFVWGFTSSKLEPVSGCVRDQNDGNKRLYKNNPDFQNLEYALIHELTHQRLIPDLYAIDVEVDDVLVKENGQLIAGSSYLPILGFDTIYSNKEQGIMGGGEYTQGYDPLTIGAINQKLGERDKNKLNFADNVPTTSKLQFLTSGGLPITNATIYIYKPEYKYNDELYDQLFKDPYNVFGITDNNGMLNLPTNSFYGDPGYYAPQLLLFLYRIQAGSQIAYGFQEISDLILAFWQGNTEEALIPIRTKIPDTFASNPSPTPSPTPTPIPVLEKAAYFQSEAVEGVGKFYPPAYLTINNPENHISIGENLTIEAWIKPNKTTYIGTLLYKVSNDLRNMVYFLGTENQSQIVNNTKLRFYLTTSAGQEGILSTKIIPDDGATWTHIAVVKNGNTLSIFINGSLEKSITLLGQVIDKIDSVLNVGEIVTSTAPLDTSLYFGSLDELRISNESRDITTLWNSGVYQQPLEVDQYTVGMWRFNNYFDDSSNYKNNAIASGFVTFNESVFKPEPTNSPSPTPTRVQSLTPTKTPTRTPTPRPTATRTPTPRPTATKTPTPTPVPTYTSGSNFMFINYIIDKTPYSGLPGKAGVTLYLYYSDQWSPIPSETSTAVKGPITSCTSVTTGGPLNEKGYCVLSSPVHHPYFFIKAVSFPTLYKAHSSSCSCQFALRACPSPVAECASVSVSTLRRYFGNVNTTGTFGGNVFYVTK